MLDIFYSDALGFKITQGRELLQRCTRKRENNAACNTKNEARSPLTWDLWRDILMNSQNLFFFGLVEDGW